MKLWNQSIQKEKVIVKQSEEKDTFSQVMTWREKNKELANTDLKVKKLMIINE